MSIYERENMAEGLTEDLTMTESEPETPMDAEQTEEPVPQEQDAPEEESSGTGFLENLRSGENFMMLMCLILAVVLLIAGGFLLYRTHALSVENAKLEKRIERDNKLKKSEAEYEAETENLEQETDTLINRYGAGNTPEKTIMFLANLSSSTGIAVTSIEFGESENVTVDENGRRLNGAAEAPDPEEAVSGSSEKEEDSGSDKKDSSGGNDNDKGQYYLYKYQTTISYTGTYSELKKAIEFIENYGERTTVNDITSTFDETTKKLTGSMTLNMYTLSGTAQEYTAPSVSGSLGNANIFG
jgi:hypothetical protein